MLREHFPYLCLFLHTREQFYVPCKLFRMPPVSCIWSALVQSTEILKKTIRVEPCTGEFINNRITPGLQFFPKGPVIVVNKFREPFSLKQAGWGPECREYKGFPAIGLRQVAGKIKERCVVLC